MKKHQMDKKEGQKTKVLRLPKRLRDKPTIIPFSKSQLLAMDNIFWWFKIQDDIPKPLEDRVARMIAHMRNYLR